MAKSLIIDPNKDPWAQLPDETTAAYEYFIRFRDMGVGKQRNHTALAQSLNLSVKTLYDYSSTHHWVERVKAWDTYQLETRQQELEKRRAIVQERTWTDTLRLREEMMSRIMSTIPDIEKLVTPVAMETIREQGSDVATVRVQVEVDSNFWRQAHEALALSNRELRIAAEMPTNFTSSKVKMDHTSSTFEDFVANALKGQVLHE